MHLADKESIESILKFDQHDESFEFSTRTREWQGLIPASLRTNHKTSTFGPDLGRNSPRQSCNIWKTSDIGEWMVHKVSVRDNVEHVEIEAEFRNLADQWYRETGVFSMTHKKVIHQAYQQIIGMGKDALPFIFKELRRNRSHWFWALESITRQKVLVSEKGARAAIAAWIKWGEENGYA